MRRLPPSSSSRRDRTPPEAHLAASRLIRPCSPLSCSTQLLGLARPTQRAATPLIRFPALSTSRGAPSGATRHKESAIERLGGMQASGRARVAGTRAVCPARRCRDTNRESSLQHGRRLPDTCSNTPRPRGSPTPVSRWRWHDARRALPLALFVHELNGATGKPGDSGRRDRTTGESRTRSSTGRSRTVRWRRSPA
jgi:hypothetical protein